MPQLAALRHRVAPAASSKLATNALGHRFAAYVLAALQACWLWWAYAQGWFLQADLSNLADSVGRGPGWGYLSSNLGGHFSPITRLVYSVLDGLSPLDYTLAIVMRVGFQAAATIVLHRLLVMLTGRRRTATVITACYAANPLLLAGTAMFTPGITMQIGQLLVLLGLVAHVRYHDTRALRHAVLAGLCLASAVLSSEQWVVAAPVFPLLSLIWFYTGGARARMRALAREWPEWLCLAPFAVVLVGVAAFADPVGARAPGVGDTYRLLRDSWLHTIAPAWMGGPFRWYGGPGTYLPFAAPTDLVIILGQVAVAATVLIGVQRHGLRSLWGWTIPLLCWALSMMLVGYRGFATYALLIAITPRYFSALVVFFAIGAALAFSPPPPRSVAEPGPDASETDIAAGESAETETAPARSTDRVQRRLSAAVLVAALLCCLVSGARFATRFGQLPAQSYVANLRASAALQPGTVNVYDTAVPSWLIASYEPNHRVTDLLRLAGVPVRTASPASVPLVAAPDGHLVRSAFVAAGRVVPPAGSCGTPLHGKQTLTLPLDRDVAAAEWWLRIVVYEQRPNTVRFELVDQRRRTARPVTGATVHLGRLEEVSLRLPVFATSAIRVSTTNSRAAICLPSIEIGAPFPASSP